jgi:hypothetical protein
LTISTKILKDSFGQKIIEGNLCIYKTDNCSFDIAYIHETRKMIKISYCSGNKVCERWVRQYEVLMFDADNLFVLMNAELLHKMATLREHVASSAQIILEKKEAKRSRVAKKLDVAAKNQ